MTRRRTLLLALVAALLVLSGCRVDSTVTVDVKPDGSGVVTAEVSFDAAAAAQVPDLASGLRLDDLRRAGWTVDGPRPDGDRTVVRVSKRFADPAALTPLMAELTGPSGVIGPFTLERTHDIGSTSYKLAGTLDPTKGPQSFGDAGVAALLGGQALGRAPQALDAAAGGSAAASSSLRLDAVLPDGRTRSWTVTFADRTTAVEATAQVRHTAVLVWAGVGIVAALAAVAAAVFGRRRRSPDRDGGVDEGWIDEGWTGGVSHPGA